MHSLTFTWHGPWSPLPRIILVCIYSIDFHPNHWWRKPKQIINETHRLWISTKSGNLRNRVYCRVFQCATGLSNSTFFLPHMQIEVASVIWGWPGNVTSATMSCGQDKSDTRPWAWFFEGTPEICLTVSASVGTVAVCHICWIDLLSTVSGSKKRAF